MLFPRFSALTMHIRRHWAVGHPALKLAGSLAAIVTAAIVAVYVDLGSHAHNAIDLAVYRRGGEAVLRGSVLYGRQFSANLHPKLAFTYPPFAAVVFIPLALLPWPLVAWTWDLALLALLLAAIIVVMQHSFPLRPPNVVGGAGLAVAATFCVAVTTRPVRDNLGFGQVDIALMTLCLLDCTVATPRWPRGLFVGLATATKLIPGLFIITLAARGERRAAIIATLTFAAATGLASVLRPAASVDFFLRLMWDPGRTGNVAYFSNQSVFGMISRTALRPYAGWIDGFAGCALVPLLVTSCARSQHCHSRSTENVVAAVATGVTATLVSPIAWVHEVVWLVPAALLLAGLARSSWARTAVVSILAVTLIAGLPYMSASVKGIAGDALADSYGVLGILVVVILCGWLSGWPVRCWLAIYRPSLKKGREAIQKGEEIMRKRLRAALRSVPRLAVLATAGVLALGTPAMAASISSTAVSARSAAPNTASTCPRGGTYGVCRPLRDRGFTSTARTDKSRSTPALHSSVVIWRTTGLRTLQNRLTRAIRLGKRHFGTLR